MHKYALTNEEAELILAASRFDTETIEQLLRRRLKNTDTDPIKLLANVLVMAESVSENLKQIAIKEMVASRRINVEDQHRVNLPSISGAAIGAIMANDCGSSCSTCAFRLGTSANQSADTLMLADPTDDKDIFYCHDGLEPGSDPVKACKGWAKARAGN